MSEWYCLECFKWNYKKEIPEFSFYCEDCDD